MGAIAKAAEQQPGRTFGDTLQAVMPRLAAVMPSGVTPEKFYQLAVSTYNTTPKLSQCSMASILSSLMQCAALGFEPSAVDGLGRFYILPRWNGKTHGYEASSLIGFKGMLDLARRSGQLLDVSARAVYEGDAFEYEYGLEERLYHVPAPGEKPDDRLAYVYCVAHFRDGGHYIDVMGRAEVDAIRRRFHTGKDGKLEAFGPWATDYAAMARKTVLRRAFPYLPVSTEAQRAAAADESVPAMPAGMADALSGVPEMPGPEPIPVEGEEVPTDEQGS